MSHKCECNCPTYGAHLRSKNLKVAYCNSASGRDATAQKKWDRELDLYSEARAAGLQPKSTKTPDIRAAMEAAS